MLIKNRNNVKVLMKKYCVLLCHMEYPLHKLVQKIETNYSLLQLSKCNLMY
ncbi:hypothetical protein PUN28_017197 [Cardiocondyla obscurior]|uniref:Uncharacterized protein n=1 Tax=Cardiocondyla obscurior TaxID=286306 RepID=A0AAW2EMC3_9HYME